jgi:4-hydroxy-tetrahydrodipicolinate reductase
MPVKLIISGCCGRMGQAIIRCALEDSTYAIAAALEASGHEAVGRSLQAVPGLTVSDDPKVGLSQGDVLIEFTTPEVTVVHAQLARELRKPMVIGTTGLSDVQRETIRSVAKAIPVVFSPNMSPGVNVLFELAQLATQRLGTSYDVEIVESHHRHKKDAPSGTAKRLAQVIASETGQSSPTVPVHAIRAGDIIGDHMVVLAGPSERLELTHRAHSRDVFARGALRAARFVVNQLPGLYDMSDVLRMKS